MKHKIYINGQEYDCDFSEIPTLMANKNENEDVFIDFENHLAELNFTITQKSARTLSRLFKTYKKPEQKLTWQDLPVKRRWHK